MGRKKEIESTLTGIGGLLYLPEPTPKADPETTRCPNCNAKRHKAHPYLIGVNICLKCNAIYGHCNRGNAYYYIYLPYWHTDADGPTDQFDWVYIDLEILGSEGIDRFHGWIHRRSRKILQIG